MFLEIASFEGDIAFFAKRHDSDTRQWFFDDFDAWFHDPGDSRAYVLLGDPGVGKSVMAGVQAQRMRRTGQLGAAFFCRHNDGTRNDPRYLLGTVACHLCECNTQYNTIVGGKGGVRKMLGNSKLGIQELFTKLLQEPLAKCNPNQHRKLVIIDALDETEYESREDFLDLIMHRFPLFPEWLVFFITSRPEDSVQFRLKKYNPCVKICAGNSDQQYVYQQHEQDIQTFLKKRIDFSRLSCTVEDISSKCHGLFLYAHYIVEELKLPVDSGKKLNQLSDLFPGDIDDFFLQNFKRVYDQVGLDLFKKLFGCVVVAPAPLPVSVISYILKREKSSHDEQQVIDAVSQFVVLRTSDQTLTFLHNLIPAWLIDKKKARKLFIDKKIAGEYLRKIFVEILSIIVNEQQLTCPLMDVDLEEYASRVAVRFLCQNSEKDSLKAVFSCLTSYLFLERRMLSERIEIYHLLEDLKLAADLLSIDEVKKKEILQEILFVLESNVLVLLKCPHLLQSCIRTASNTVREAVLIPQLSTALLEWNVFAFPDAKIADMHCFATSFDKKTVAGVKGRSLLFFDASTAKAISGPFEISEDTIDIINQLKFSPDGKFIFFGRLDKWFSVERQTVEEFHQFSANSHQYEWGVFSSDGKSIVVKRNFLRNPSTCKAKSCFLNLLALWALKEIEQSRDDETTVRFCPQVLCRVPGAQIKRFSKRLGMREDSDRTRETLPPYDPSCYYCCRLRELTETSQESSLAAVRQLVIELYPWIFNYQVWDLQSGKPVLQQVFSQGVQLNPFTYFCHVSCAYSECGQLMGCSGIEEAMSVCNIAAVTVVCCALLGGFYFGRALELEQEWKRELEREREREWRWELERMEREWKRGWRWKLEGIERGREEEWEWELKREWMERERELERKQERELKRECERERKREWEHTLELWSKLQQVLSQNRELELEGMLEGMLKQELKTEVLDKLRLDWKRLVSTGLFKEFYNDGLRFGLCSNISKGFQDLVYDVNGENCICVSPEMKLLIEAGDSLKLLSLQTFANKEGIIFVSGSLLTASNLQAPHVKNCCLSPSGKLIAVHQSIQIELYSLAEPGGKFLHSIYESECEFTVPCFAFSADNTVLFFCVQDNENGLHFYLWDIQKKVILASFESQEILDAECCCLSSNKRKLIFCGNFVIEIWQYAGHHCRFLTSFAVERPYDSVKFSHCTVSSDNQFLVCCIADVILVYRLHASDFNASNINSSKRVLRGHLGKIEFCQFLKVNRYLISYGVDGMVFLWDLSKCEAVGFARIAQGKDSIVSMAVSPEEDVAVCFTSSCRLCVIKLCGLDSAPSLKSLMVPLKGNLTTGKKTSQQISVDIASTSQGFTSIDHGTNESLSSSDLEEGYYLEDLDESD